MSVKTGVEIKASASFDFDSDAFQHLMNLEVLVGVPEESTDRPPEDEDGNPVEITNAAIAYIQDNGAPEANIPARPFMREGIDNAKDAVIRQLERGMKAALRNNDAGVGQAFIGVGLAAQRGIQNAIKAGVPPPLSERTLKDRARRGRKGAMLELQARDAGESPGIELATPLMDTGELLQSIKFAIRRKDERGRKPNED